MSVADSQIERVAAEDRLRAEPIETLRRDLEYWELQRGDHVDEHNDLAARQAVVTDLYRESVTWVTIIADELRRRRDERRHH